MFISSYEKEQMRISIRTLQAQVVHLFDEINKLKGDKVSVQKPAPKFIFRTEEAPWGYKKDGTPRKRSGRPPQVMEIAS
jgi:hypothetical protein